MKIALLGYGKMGHEIEKIALKRNHTIEFIASSKNADFKWSELKQCDVAIEFSTPSTVVQNIYKCFEAQVPVVVGTTAWQKQLNEVIKSCSTKNASLLYASNFSIGVNLFFEINKKLAQLMQAHTDYNCTIDEIHHTQKLDAPSGTAVTLADQIIENHSNYSSWHLNENQGSTTDLGSTQNSITITAFREEDVKGTHSIYYENSIDKITLTHEAKTRAGFALGSVIAAEFIAGKKGVFTMKDVLNF
jgi:4-hydroxy-tetrahydrodipicolinate reductase